MSNVYEKLQTARVLLQNKKFSKSGKNKFAGFDYFELSDILPYINQIFSDLKLFSLFKIDDNKAFLIIINSEKPDEEIEFLTPIAELELKGCNAIQALGGINTYCKRYLYLNALEIVEADLFDSTTGKEEQEIKEEVKPIKAKKQTKAAEKNNENDFDIITGLAAINDLDNLKIYWKQNETAVIDRDAFIEACKRRKEAIGTKEAKGVY